MADTSPCNQSAAEALTSHSIMETMGAKKDVIKFNAKDTRQDFPVVYNKKRGSSTLAIAIAADPGRLAHAKGKLSKGFYASGSWRTMTTHWKKLSKNEQKENERIKKNANAKRR